MFYTITEISAGRRLINGSKWSVTDLTLFLSFHEGSDVL